MELDMGIIGNRIKNRRKELHLTQLDVKEMTGISSGNMSDIERGNRLPAAATLVLLAEALKCSIDYLLTGKSPEGENSVASLEAITGEDAAFLELYHNISDEDREELFLIAQMKYQRAKKRLGGKTGEIS